MGPIVILIIILFGWLGFSTDPVAIAEPVTVSCVSVDGSTSDCDDIWQPIQTGDVEGVIVGVVDGGEFTNGEDYWYPSDDDVAEAEQAIADEQGSLDHLRQYVGFVEDGDRKILVNGFCDAFDTDWRHEPVLVMDGGDCYFTAVYNVESSVLESFIFNGEA